MPDMDWRHRLARPVTEPVARILAHTPITPDAISWFGFAVVIGSAWLIVLRHNLWAGVVVLAGSALDAFDGALARATNSASRFGAVLDSTLDRLSEGMLLLALIIALSRQNNQGGVALAGAALLFSYMVSYIRARSEGAGFSCGEGWFTRTERILVLSLGLLTGYVTVALAVMAGLSLLTAFQRLLAVWQKARIG